MSIGNSLKIWKGSQNFPTICVFLQRHKKLTHDVLNFFEEYAKIMHFCYFLKRFFENFQNFSGIGGFGPLTPYEADPKKCSSRTEILSAQLLHIFKSWLQLTYYWKFLRKLLNLDMKS